MCHVNSPTCFESDHCFFQLSIFLYFQGKCQRKEPPCKYLHPPQHLREQLLQNGRNNLILKNLQIQAAQQAALNQGIVPGLIPVVSIYKMNIPYNLRVPVLVTRHSGVVICFAFYGPLAAFISCVRF